MLGDDTLGLQFLTADRAAKNTPGSINMVFKKRELVDYVPCHIQAQPDSDHVREIKK